MGPFQMSSRKPVSTARPQTFWSMEYGEDLVTSIGSACSAANAIALSRVMPESRTGASTRRSGASAEADLEAHLVVALAGAAVSERARAVPAGRLDHVLDDHRPGQRRDQRVPVHVQRVGPQRRQAVVVGELVLEVEHLRLDRTAGQRPLADDGHVLAALADVGGDRDHLGPGLGGDPAVSYTHLRAHETPEHLVCR